MKIQRFDIRWVIVALLSIVNYQLSIIHAVAQTRFRTAELARLAYVCGLTDSTMDTARRDAAHPFKDVVVERQADSVVCHVGLRLFSDEMIRIAKSPVLPFLERYFLQLLHPSEEKTAAMMMRDDRFRFERGSLKMLEQLTDSDAFSYNYELRSYHASWSRNGKEILAVSFPKEYQLLAGVSKIEAEQLIESDIRHCALLKKSEKCKVQELIGIDSTTLVKTAQPSYYILPGVPYIDKRINSDLYVEKKDSTLSLVVDMAHPAESAANILLSRFTPGDYIIRIDQTCYGYQRKHFDVPLRQWIVFCSESGCEVYCGVEGLDKDVVKASLFVVNQAEGYNHVLYVEVPFNVIEQREGIIEARLDCYIPMHNVAGLFAKDKKVKHKEQKIYEK